MQHSFFADGTIGLQLAGKTALHIHDQTDPAPEQHQFYAPAEQRPFVQMSMNDCDPFLPDYLENQKQEQHIRQGLEHRKTGTGFGIPRNRPDAAYLDAVHVAAKPIGA